MQEIGTEGVKQAPGDCTDSPQPPGMILIASNHAGDHVTMPAQILGGAVQGHRRA